MRQLVTTNIEPARFGNARPLNVEELEKRTVFAGGLQTHSPELFSNPDRSLEFVERTPFASPEMIVRQRKQIPFDIGLLDGRHGIGRGFWVGFRLGIRADGDKGERAEN